MLKKVFKNDYIFALISKIICVALGFAYTIMLSRYLGADLRGEYSIIQNYAAILSAFIGFGIYQAYPYLKKSSKNKEDQSNLYHNIISNIISLFLIYSVLAVFLAIFLPTTPRIKMTLIILPLAFVYKQINYILLIENPRICNKTDIILSIIDILFVLSLILFTKANLLYCFLFLFFDRLIYAFLPIKNLKINFLKELPKLDKNVFKYIKYGILPMITIFLMTFNHKVDIVMLSLFKNVTTAEIGVYSLGVMLAEKIWMLPDTLTNILQSKLANGKDENEVAKISRISFAVTAIALLFVALFGKKIILFAYGKEFSEAYKITVIILFGVLGMVFYKVVYAYNIVIGKRKINFILLLLSVILNIILNFLFINKYGVIGAGYASLIAFISCGLLFLISFINKTKISILDMFLLKKKDIKYLISFIKKENV